MPDLQDPLVASVSASPAPQPRPNVTVASVFADSVDISEKVCLKRSKMFMLRDMYSGQYEGGAYPESVHGIGEKLAANGVSEAMSSKELFGSVEDLNFAKAKRILWTGKVCPMLFDFAMATEYLIDMDIS